MYMYVFLCWGYIFINLSFFIVVIGTKKIYIKKHLTDAKKFTLYFLSSFCWKIFKFGTSMYIYLHFYTLLEYVFEYLKILTGEIRKFFSFRP